MESKNKMIYRFLGNTGLKVSVLSFGNWLMDYNPEQQAAHSQIIKIAYQNGINFFDTAEGYGHGKGEAQFGRIFKKHNWPRESLVISSKIFFGGKLTALPGPNNFGTSRKHCMEAIDQILERLQMDYLDVVFLHRPDDDTPMQETVRAMNQIIESGKAMYWGTSQWSGAQLGEAHAVCEELKLIKPVVEQCEYNMLVRTRFQNQYRHFFEKKQLGTTIWSPLASGMLTGKYNDGKVAKDGRFDNPDNPIAQMVWKKYWSTQEKSQKTIKSLCALADLAKEIGCTQAQLAIAWAIVNTDTSTCLLGATKVKQFEENLGCLDVARKWNPELDKKVRAIMDNDPTPELNWSTFPPTLYPNRRETSVRKFE